MVRYLLRDITVPHSDFLYAAVGRRQLTCSEIEYVTLNPPSGQTCGQYMERFISSAGGYLQNAEASNDCMFCSARTTDELLSRNFNIDYKNRWWHLGVFCAFIIFNVS
jgi:ATP-binding cassette subfamily G (WHITE) protein 2 (SNQ2)